MNKLTQSAQSYRDKLVAIMNNMKTRTTTTTIEKEQGIIFTNNEASTGQSQGSTRKTSRKRNQ